MNMAKKIIKSALLWSLLLLSTYCTQQPAMGERDVLNYSTHKEFNIDSFVNYVEYIPLEITAESSVMEATQILVDEKYIYIYDAFSSAVKCFLWNGHFVKQLGSRGQGPGEYSRISSICMDEENVYVLDFKNKILVFDKTNLSFRKEYNHAYGTTFFKTNFGWIFMDFNKDYALNVFDNQFNPLYEAVPNLVKSGYIEWPAYRFYSTDGIDYVFPPHYNQIFCITQDSCYLHQTIAYGNYQTIPNDVYQTKSDHNAMADIYNDDTHVQYCKHLDGKLFFITSFRVGQNAFLGVNKKSDKSTYYISSNSEETNTLSFVFSPDCCYNDSFLSFCNMEKLQKQELCVKSKKFQEMCDTVSNESDVLVLWTIKEDY